MILNELGLVVGGDFNSDLNISRYKDDDGLKPLRAAARQARS